MDHDVYYLLDSKKRQADALCKILSVIDAGLQEFFETGYEHGMDITTELITEVIEGDRSLQDGSSFLYWFDVLAWVESYFVELEESEESPITESSNPKGVRNLKDLYESGILWGIQDTLGKLGMLCSVVKMGGDSSIYCLIIKFGFPYTLVSLPFFVLGDSISLNQKLIDMLGLYHQNRQKQLPSSDAQ